MLFLFFVVDLIFVVVWVFVVGLVFVFVLVFVVVLVYVVVLVFVVVLVYVVVFVFVVVFDITNKRDPWSSLPRSLIITCQKVQGGTAWHSSCSCSCFSSCASGLAPPQRGSGTTRAGSS